MKVNQNFYFYSAIAFALILPISRALISLFVIVLPLVWLFDGHIRDKINDIKNNPILLSITIFLGYIFISLFWSSNTEEGANMARLYSYWLILFVFATKLKKEQVSLILSAFLAGIFISEIIAYGVFFDLWSAKYATKEYLSPFMMHIDYSIFLAFASILLLSRVISKDYTIKEKVIFGLFFCTVTGNLFLAPGRVGQIAFLIGFIAIFILHYKLTIKAIIGSIIGLVVVFFVAFSLSNTFQKRILDTKQDLAMIQNLNYDGSWGSRIAFIMTGYEIFKKDPIFGVGLGGSVGSSQKVFDEKVMPFSDTVKEFILHNHFHNQYLMVIIEGGIVGILLMLNILFQIIRVSLKNQTTKELGVVFLAIYCFSCVGDPLWMKQFTIALWCFIVGILAIKWNESAVKA